MNLGIYIHLPYCLSKCPYCDFNSYGVGTEFPEQEYTNSVLREIRQQKDRLIGKEVISVFFGGGTPSLFSSDSINLILNELFEFSEKASDVEITLEVNPSTASIHKLKEFYDIGVNRISLGVQSFSPRKLKFYGRLNTPEDTVITIGYIKDAGFKNFNLDLIYGSSSETLNELENDLLKATAFEPTHLSLYCLTIEPDTEFGVLYSKGQLVLPDEAVLADMYEFCSDFMQKKGYLHYEISNFCLAGFECRHNLRYWQSKDYIGFGAGAHSYLSGYDPEYPWGVRWANIKTPSHYINSVKSDSAAVAKIEKLSKDQSLEDEIMMGMRLSDGMNLYDLSQKYSASMNENELEELITENYLFMNKEKVSFTKRGRILSNEIVLKMIGTLDINA